MEKKDLPIFLSILIVGLFTIFFIFTKNYEFISYIITLGILIFFILKTDKYFHYSQLAKWGFLIWVILHMAGGSIYVFGTKLYGLMLISLIGEPFNILKYDQVVHFFCYLVFTSFVYSIIKSFTKKNSNKIIVGIITILAAVGVGAFNEIIEFSAVVFFGATGVGGYYNNALDLIFNFLGSLVAVIFLSRN